MDRKMERAGESRRAEETLGAQLEWRRGSAGREGEAGDWSCNILIEYMNKMVNCDVGAMRQ